MAFTTKVSHFRVQNTPLKDTNTNEKGKFKRMLRIRLLEKEGIGYEIVLRGIQQCFLHGEAQNEPLLKFIHGSEVLGGFSGTFFTLWSRKNYVSKREFMYV